VDDVAAAASGGTSKPNSRIGAEGLEEEDATGCGGLGRTKGSCENDSMAVSGGLPPTCCASCSLIALPCRPKERDEQMRA
jgi:hypothetical protein